MAARFVTRLRSRRHFFHRQFQLAWRAWHVIREFLAARLVAVTLDLSRNQFCILELVLWVTAAARGRDGASCRCHRSSSSKQMEFDAGTRTPAGSGSENTVAKIDKQFATRVFARVRLDSA